MNPDLLFELNNYKKQIVLNEAKRSIYIVQHRKPSITEWLNDLEKIDDDGTKSIHEVKQLFCCHGWNYHKWYLSGNSRSRDTIYYDQIRENYIHSVKNNLYKNLFRPC